MWLRRDEVLFQVAIFVSGTPDEDLNLFQRGKIPTFPDAGDWGSSTFGLAQRINMKPLPTGSQSVP